MSDPLFEISTRRSGSIPSALKATSDDWGGDERLLRHVALQLHVTFWNSEAEPPRPRAQKEALERIQAGLDRLAARNSEGTIDAWASVALIPSCPDQQVTPPELAALEAAFERGPAAAQPSLRDARLTGWRSLAVKWLQATKAKAHAPVLVAGPFKTQWPPAVGMLTECEKAVIEAVKADPKGECGSPFTYSLFVCSEPLARSLNLIP